MSDPIVIVSAARTAMGSFQGGFSGLTAANLGAEAIKAAVVRAALEEWRASGLLDEETGKRLLDDLTPLPFDWYRLGRYALWSALTCILIGVAALLGDELFLELISRLFVMTELGRSLFLILAAAGLFFWGVRRRRRAPQKRLTNEGLFFLGVLAIAGSLASLAAWLYAYGGEDIGFLNISSLFLLAAVIYGALGLLLELQHARHEVRGGAVDTVEQPRRARGDVRVGVDLTVRVVQRHADRLAAILERKDLLDARQLRQRPRSIR